MGDQFGCMVGDVDRMAVPELEEITTRREKEEVEENRAC